MQPRIYTYKITFEEIPDWYWGSHKEKKYGDGYLGSPDTHAWKWEFYTPILEICEFFPYTDEGWKKARETEDRCIRPDLNNPLCLNEHVGGFMSLESSRRGIAAANKEKDCLGRSITSMKGAITAHKEKDIFGRSLHALKSFERVNDEKDDLGRSITAVKGGKTGCREKKRKHGEKCRDEGIGIFSPDVTDEQRKIWNSSPGKKKGAAATNSQKWEDPQHPELGRHSPGTLVRIQKSRGYPHGKGNRVKTT